MKKRKLGSEIIEDINVALIICSFFSLVFLGYFSYFILQADYRLLPYLTIPLIFGVLVENRRLKSDWKMLALKLMLAVILASGFIFFTHINSLDLPGAIKKWIYLFIFFFALISAIYHDKKVTAKITEGVTLLQSISIIYWVLTYDYLSYPGFFQILVLIIGTIFSVFSFYNAFTYTKLTPGIRLFLSIWSSSIMTVFALVYIYRVFNFQQFTGDPFMDYLINIIQYFFLGVALIYIIQNARMIVVYLPSQNRAYDEDHKKRIKRMNKLHIWRYSKEQVKIKDSCLILVFTSLVYTLNYFFRLIPAFTLIWIVLWSAPFVVIMKNRVLNNLKSSTSLSTD